MTPQAGLLDARDSQHPPPGWRRAAAALALGLLLAAAPPTHAASGADTPASEARRDDEKREAPHAARGGAARDPFLARPISLIESSFRAGRPEPLTPLLPGEGKTFVSLGRAGCAAGYYSRDQVYFILGSIFSRRNTLHFSIRPQEPFDPPAEPEKREVVGPVYCIATWTYSGVEGGDGETEIHFVLLMKKGVWSLVEIREAR